MKKTIENLFVGTAIIAIGATIIKLRKNSKKKLENKYYEQGVEDTTRNYINLTEVAFSKVKKLENEVETLEEEVEEYKELKKAI